jgi:anti-sigma factor RsiW
MMEYQEQLKLQAYLDGELPEAEAREMANRLARDRDAVALLGELRQTRQALAGFESAIRLPESGDFYWSKIRREIERLEPAAVATPAPVSFWAKLRRALVPAGALALLAIAGLMVVNGPQGLTSVPEGETALADASAFTYRDFAAGTTLVWLSYPAENRVAE